MARAEDHALAAVVATEAGDLLVALRAAMVGGPGADLRARGDRESHDFILSELGRLRPDDPVLSEEAADDAARLQAQRLWIVDPLDGTREFGESGRADWAVHVALVIDGQPAAGAVALPARGLTLHTAEPPVLAAAWTGAPRMVVSRTRPPEVTTTVAGRLGAELVPMGSAGAKAMAVVLGEADVYLHGGGQYEWDSAAPVAVAAAAGLHVSRLDGSALRYNQPTPWLPDLLVCRPELADTVLQAVNSI